jgi:hypothetical protein
MSRRAGLYVLTDRIARPRLRIPGDGITRQIQRLLEPFRSIVEDGLSMPRASTAIVS